MKGGWVTKRLGEVCELINGKNQSEVANPEGKYPIYGSGGEMGRADDFRCPAGCTIIGRKGSINNPLFVAEKFWNVDTAYALSPTSVDPKYLYYFCRSYDFGALNCGTTIPSLTSAIVKDVQIPFAPLPEQQRIVAKLDAAFAKIDRLKANAEKNLANAKELFQSALNEAMRPKPGWVEKRLGEHYLITSSKRVFKEQWKSSGVPFYRAREIVRLARDGFVENELFISEEMFSEYGKKYGLPNADDIMITGVGTLGVCYVVKEGDRFYFKDGNIIWLKKTSEELDSRYVELCFMTDDVIKQVHANQGATVGTYTIEMAKATVVYAPSIDMQRLIVEDIQRLKVKFSVLQSNYTHLIADCAEMRQAVLKEAFEGKL